MNWINALYDLYGKNEMLAGEYQPWGDGKQNPLILLPPSHTTVLAQIEVAIDGQGNFLHARCLAKEEALTLIPVSEASAIRTSGAEPHPLMDTLQYIAGDYDSHVRPETDKKGNPIAYRKRYDAYIGMLEDWCTSQYAHPKAEAVYAYLKKAQIMRDLIREKILAADEENLLIAGHKIQNIEQQKAFVRFRVDTGETPDLLDNTGRFSSEIWEDTTLQKSYCDYFMSRSAAEDLCYLTGSRGRTTVSYSKKIRNEGDGTKLISSNDTSGYTFRGRFRTSSEAFSIGYDASQKVLNALKWIIRKQGYTRDGLCIVTWETDLKPYVSFLEDPAEVVAKAPKTIFDDDDDRCEAPDTNHITAAQFNSALNGYKREIGNTSNMVVMALDSATPGRLAITYFNRMPVARYLENIAFWHESCCWRHEKFVDKRRILFDGMLSLNNIALALYGTEQNGFLKLKADGGKAPMLISTFQRLAPCMLERKRIPKDMVRLAVLRASAPLAYENYNWRKILAAACSMVKKEKFDWKGEKWDMALDYNCKDRSYLYGRLLAAADLTEKATFDADEKRETNAMRYMNAFSRQPYRTWKIIAERLHPYKNKLSRGSNIYFEKLLSEIHSSFVLDQFADDSPLKGLYLLGYYCQVSEHFSKKKDKQKDETTNETGGDIE